MIYLGTGKGNIAPGAEFNFYSDPESAFVALNDLTSPMTLVGWEVCERHWFSWVRHLICDTVTDSYCFDYDVQLYL